MDAGVAGFRFGGLACGIKKSGAADLAVIVADRPVACAGVFTKNLVVAAPVVRDRALLAAGGLVRAIVVNSGNANACTGEQGARDADRMGALAAAALGCAPGEVMVASTGVIGAPLPMEKLEAGIPRALDAATADGLAAFSRAIMTTDTRPKVRTGVIEAGGRRFQVAGAAKGAGMIHPNMATMLGFLVTDAPVAPADLDALWRRVCQDSFNAITIDGDTSTNDTALLLAGGGGEPLAGEALAAFEAGLLPIARELARDIVRDAEGGTKTVSVTVAGATDFAAAQRVAEAIALSPLVKTALHGEDPNWGRIIAAAGRSGVAVEPAKLRLTIGDVLLYAGGEWCGKEAEVAARAVMQTPEYPIRLDLQQGAVAHTVHTCDFGADYVRINADYRS
ncbi:MAG: bifunctional glutamate N-acetyltransferase/amino-acid acetyltransferase ArgJ [Myxococcales bacterium]|nr:bifunctional glutamate N-acetyltransferase/amino-acid acetyltransferase ArgJ [Myxococcales bacterium]